MDVTIDDTKHLRIQEGECFAERIMSLEQNMYRLALSILHNPEIAEDAVADTVYKAYTSRHKLKDQEKLRSWLFKILVNQCKTVLKKQGREVSIEAIAEPPAVSPPDFSLWELVKHLPDNQQCVITLYYYEGYSVKEIADTLHLRESSVRSRMCRGRDTLRQWLEESL